MWVPLLAFRLSHAAEIDRLEEPIRALAGMKDLGAAGLPRRWGWTGALATFPGGSRAFALP